MTLHEFIRDKVFPAGFCDTMMRWKSLPNPHLNGANSLNYAYEDYDEEMIKKHCTGEVVLAACNSNYAGYTCWLGLDIDCNSKNKEFALRNLYKALTLLENCPHQAYLTMSNNYGGYHLWIFPTDPMEMQFAIAWIDDFTKPNLFERRPTYNIRPQVDPIYSSNILRLPGKSPKTGEWSKILIDKKWIDVREMQ